MSLRTYNHNLSRFIGVFLLYFGVLSFFKYGIGDRKLFLESIFELMYAYYLWLILKGKHKSLHLLLPGLIVGSIILKIWGGGNSPFANIDPATLHFNVIISSLAILPLVLRKTDQKSILAFSLFIIILNTIALFMTYMGWHYLNFGDRSFVFLIINLALIYTFWHTNKSNMKANS